MQLPTATRRRVAACLAWALAALAAAAAEEEPPFVRVGRRVVHGEWRLTAARNETYAAFRGIPYAAPPVGPLRFQAPQPPAEQIVTNATAWGSRCLQLAAGTTPTLDGDEDCLYLNVFVPHDVLLPAADAARSPAPVVVFFPGGAFVEGAADLYGPDFFMEARSAVLVTANYRLGVFGFLNIPDVKSQSVANAGLLDQVAVLTWVQSNIRDFGGDPRRVAILGQSAGAACVHAHLLSPASQGLFTSAVALSGDLLSPWALPRNEKVQRQNVLRLTGCGGGEGNGTSVNQTAEEELACLRAVPANVLAMSVGSVNLVQEMTRYGQLPFTPVVDHLFLPDHPKRMMQQGVINRQPYMTGVTDAESLLFFKGIPANVTVLKKLGQALFKVLHVNTSLTNVSLVSEMLTIIEKVATQGFFAKPAIQTSRLLSSAGIENFLYRFTADTPMDAIKKDIQPPVLQTLPGVPHAGDLFYLFVLKGSNTSMPENSIEMRTLRAYVKMIINMAATGNPTPDPVDCVDLECKKWPPFDEKNLYLDIGVDGLSVKEITGYKWGSS